jgi:hypothetical protein
MNSMRVIFKNCVPMYAVLFVRESGEIKREIEERRENRKRNKKGNRREEIKRKEVK